MDAVFLGGELQHPPLRAVVLGRALEGGGGRPAQLPDHRALWDAGQGAALIVAAQGFTLHGLLLDRPDAQDMARLAYYMAATGSGDSRHPVAAKVMTAQGQVAAAIWRADDMAVREQADWDIGAWTATWAAITTQAATEVMDYYGTKPADAVARAYPMIMARATSHVAALTDGARDDPALPDSGLRRRDVTPLALTRPYTDYFAVEAYDLRFRRFDGSDSAAVRRAVFSTSDAAILLPYDPQRDRVMLVEQFRAGPFARGDLAPWLLEPVAGRIDPGETAVQSATREAMEEAGLILHRLECVSRNYPSPGSTSEYFHIFVGLCDLPDRQAGTAGLAAEDEDIRSHILPFTQFLDLLDRDLLNVGPLVLAGHWLARHHARLRAAS